MFKEQRLIGYTIEQLNKQRVAGGVKQLAVKGQPVGTTRSSAATNAANQQAIHQANSTATRPLTGLAQIDPNSEAALGDYKRDATGALVPKDTVLPTPKADISGTPLGYVDTSGLSPMNIAGVQESPEAFAQRVAAVEQRNAALLQQQQLKQEIAQKQGQSQIAGGAAAASATQNAGNSIGGRFQGPSDSAPDRQAFIEQKRSEGLSDVEIRKLINTLPPEQTGGAKPTSPTDAPQSTGNTSSSPTASTTETSATGQTTASGDKKAADGTQPRPVNPNTNLLRTLAATVEDPILQAILNAEADRAELADMGDPMGQAQFNAGADAQAIAKPYDAIDAILNRAYKTGEKVYASQKEFLKGQYDRNEKLMADKEENIKNQLSFANDKARRDQVEANKKLLDSQTIMLALGGGFGSADGNRELAESRLKGEQAIIDLNKEFGFKNTDVSLAFTEAHNQAYDSYQQAWLAATDNFETRVSNIDLQGISNQQAKSAAITGAYQDYVKEIKDGRKEAASIISAATQTVYNYIQKEKEVAATKENTALERIDYLLKNYPRESVAEAIKELGKDVTSFDVQALIDNPTLAEIEKAEAAQAKRSSGGGGGYASGFLPSSMQAPALPEVSFDEFLQTKIDELESKAAQSFSPAKRAELMVENAEEWEKQYEATYLAASRTASATKASADIVAQFGQPVVDAARAVMDNTYGGTNPVKNAAKAFGVSEGNVATALAKLRQTGDIAETSVLSPDQQKAWNGLRKNLESDPYYVTYNGAKLAIGRIEAALTQQNGVSDIAAINGFQNGIVDPNATVRSEDVDLIQSAMSWADRVDLDYWREKVISGAKLPQSMREQMAQTSRAITAAYERAYREQTLSKYQQEVTQAGLPQSVLQQYGASTGSSNVSSEVQSFADTYFSQ